MALEIPMKGPLQTVLAVFCGNKKTLFLELRFV